MIREIVKTDYHKLYRVKRFLAERMELSLLDTDP